MRARRPVLLAIASAAIILGCTPQQVADTLVQLALLDQLCASSYAYTIHPPVNGSQYGYIAFMAVVGNPGAETKGSVKLLMGVDGSNLPPIGGHISAQSMSPSFDSPTTTVYPANNSLAYTSPVLITLPYAKGSVYNIEIHKWLAGQPGWDATTCHNFTKTNLAP